MHEKHLGRVTQKSGDLAVPNEMQGSWVANGERCEMEGCQVSFQGERHLKLWHLNNTPDSLLIV